MFCLVGDGELDEGSNHEAIAVAGRLNLSQLTVIVLDNQSSSHGWPNDIATRFSVEDWSVSEVDGRDHDEIHEALVAPHPNRPHAVVAAVNQQE